MSTYFICWPYKKGYTILADRITFYFWYNQNHTADLYNFLQTFYRVLQSSSLLLTFALAKAGDAEELHCFLNSVYKHRFNRKHKQMQASLLHYKSKCTGLPHSSALYEHYVPQRSHDTLHNACTLNSPRRKITWEGNELCCPHGTTDYSK